LCLRAQASSSCVFPFVAREFRLRFPALLSFASVVDFRASFPTKIRRNVEPFLDPLLAITSLQGLHFARPPAAYLDRGSLPALRPSRPRGGRERRSLRGLSCA